MPTVEVSQIVPRDRDVIYKFLCDFETFPRLMRNVESVTIIERGDHFSLSEWVTRLQGSRFRWIERDEFFPEAFRITYEQVSGDLKQFSGHWQLESTQEGTRVTLVTHFEFGIPMLAALLNPLAKIAIRENARDMVRAISDALVR